MRHREAEASVIDNGRAHTDGACSKEDEFREDRKELKHTEGATLEFSR